MPGKLAAILLAAISLAGPSVAQESAAPVELPRFEVAGIEPVDPNRPHTMGVQVYPGGRVEISGFPLKSLIVAAFDVGFWQISGGGEWTSRDEYFVEAKPPEALRPRISTLRHTLFGIDDPFLRQMLQALLIDRFQLQFHRETRTGDVYLLARNNRPLALQPAKIPQGASQSDSFGSVGYVGGRWSMFATTVPQLAKFASGMILHAPVLDRTNLTGAFDYRQPQPDLDPQYGGDRTDSFQAFLRHAGLQWKRTKGPVETFVIDRAAKPSPN